VPEAGDHLEVTAGNVGSEAGGAVRAGQGVILAGQQVDIDWDVSI